MKKLFKIIQCGVFQIKKYFFIGEKTDFYQECEELLKFNDNDTSEEEMVHTEEYLENYNVTTRWQTI